MQNLLDLKSSILDQAFHCKYKIKIILKLGCIMSLLQNKRNFFARWGIELTDTHDDVVVFEGFKKRIVKYFAAINRVGYDENDLYYELKINSYKLGIYFQDSEFDSYYNNVADIIGKLILEHDSLHGLLFDLKILIDKVLSYDVDWSSNSYDNPPYQTGLQLFGCERAVKNKELLQELIDVSGVDINVIYSTNNEGLVEIDFFPKGSKLLDDRLVTETYHLLLDNSRAQYRKALQCYLNKDYENSANHLRKTLESWLKSVFNIEKTLDKIVTNQQYHIKKIIKAKVTEKHGADKDSTLTQLAYIDKFIDHTVPVLSELFAKYEIPHNDGGLKHAKTEIVSLLDAEVEFMIYQTGAIIRLINKLLDVN